MASKAPKTRRTQQQKNKTNETRRRNIASGKTKPRKK